ncbi:hypothetical protein [Anabaena sp. CS-542/02]|uniref:hypothetical protein n=1 Tax=Anabaena sp. CS-542/02 TaxID=3021719 RepID=UPI00232C92D9|nr:hypothetical protein [Anabaena sp. CS-542/02]MDB9445312.1 hypothetical protein [Anabaena sp. CS-542/02]
MQRACSILILHLSYRVDTLPGYRGWADSERSQTARARRHFFIGVLPESIALVFLFDWKLWDQYVASAVNG